MNKPIFCSLLLSGPAIGFGSTSFFYQDTFRLPSDSRRGLDQADGPYFQKLDCTDGEFQTKSGLHSRYETIDLQQYVCVGVSEEHYVCQGDLWSLVTIDCPDGMLQIPSKPSH